MKNGLLNVIAEDTLKQLLTDVTESIADVLSHTFGPYGQNALIQSTGSVYATKDGWNVLQMLRVSDKNGESAVTVNALKKLHQDVAQAVLLNAGDGTTQSTLGAANLSRRVSKYMSSHAKEGNPIDSRAITKALETACEEIIDELQNSAIGIDDTNMADIIYRIALVATNWDEQISGLIRDIYCKTKNPIIKVEDSGTLDTYVKYVEGYDLVGHLELPHFALTSPAKGLFEADNPLILTFGSAVHKDKLDTMMLIGGFLASENRKLVLVAPTYDADFLSTLNATNSALIQQGSKPVNLVLFKCYTKTSIDKDCLDDFACATGGITITNELAEIEQVFGQLGNVVLAKKDPSRKVTTKSEKRDEEIITNCIETLTKFGGACDHLVANDKSILASGLYKKNKKEFERRKENLVNELEQKHRQYHAESSLTEMVRLKRLRLGKMQDQMGIIKIGGFGAAHLKAKKDAIDDATRACEVAYQDGYILDGGLAIPMACESLMEQIEDDLEENKDDKELISELAVVRMIYDAFKEVTCTLYNNKYNDKEKSMNLVNLCLKEGKYYDIIKEEYTEELITPVAVCREVLNGCLRLVLINATSNQFVFMNEDDLIRAIQAGPVVEDNEEEE